VTPPDIPDFVSNPQTPMPTAAAMAAAAVSARLTAMAPVHTVSTMTLSVTESTQCQANISTFSQ